MKSDSKLQGCTNFKLRQLTRVVTQHYDAELGKDALKTTQYSLLTHLSRQGPIRPGELARLLRMDASTLTRNLKPLELAGWVQQCPGSDGRSRQISITEEGQSKRREAQRHWRVAQDALAKRLGVERVQALHQLIDESLLLLADQVTVEELH